MHSHIDAILACAGNFAATCGSGVSLFDFDTRDFHPALLCAFCEQCPYNKANSCGVTAHKYGCYEAERWQGQYIYYCPASLAFVSTVVYEEGRAAYALIAGPMVMGEREDIGFGHGFLSAALLATLPRRSPGEVNALAAVQKMLAAQLTQGGGGAPACNGAEQADLLNTLYDVTTTLDTQREIEVSFTLEKKLREMIIKGDKQGATELINQLLGTLYFENIADFGQIKNRAKELIVLFSRASLDGGADVQQILGSYHNYLATIDKCGTLDELSALLVGIFNRFVGYVFDFGKFEHADILHKVVAWARKNYPQKITLEDAAAHVCLSRSYLSVIFREEYGMTFKDFVNTLRIQKSQELLANPQLSLAEIADLVGYNDQSYFTKVFTRFVGISPGQYRKSNTIRNVAMNTLWKSNYAAKPAQSG